MGVREGGNSAGIDIIALDQPIVIVYCQRAVTLYGEVLPGNNAAFLTIL